MAENESLDLGSSPRMRVGVRRLPQRVVLHRGLLEARRALISGLRKALKQFQEKGVTLADLLKSRDCPQALRQLLRKAQGHDYARLFAEAAAASGPTEKDCVAGWIDAVARQGDGPDLPPGRRERALAHD